MTSSADPPAGAGAPRVCPDDAEYLRRAREEAEYWGRPHLFGCEAQETRAATDPFEEYTNRRFTGDRRVCWYETIGRRGTFHRGLLLGTSGLRQEARILETNPALHLTFCDISAEALARRGAVLAARFPGRVATRVMDLNFAVLEAERYDLIVSASTMHHIINLEHLASQVNRALVRGGLLFLQDYVGEARYQMSASKRRLFEWLYRRERRRHDDPDIVWMSEEERDLSPFCGVRSDEILGVFAAHLEPVEVRTTGAVLFCVLLVRPAAGRPHSRPFLARHVDRLRRRLRPPLDTAGLIPISKAFARDLLLLDELACDAGLLRPCNAFAVYRKR